MNGLIKFVGLVGLLGASVAVAAEPVVTNAVPVATNAVPAVQEQQRQRGPGRGRPDGMGRPEGKGRPEGAGRPAGAPQDGRGKMLVNERFSAEKTAKINTEREALHKLAEEARAEVDPVKKAAMIDELRTRMTEGANRIQADFRKRLLKAEADVRKMREKLTSAENHQKERVEDQLRKMLSGRKGGGKRGGPERTPPDAVN